MADKKTYSTEADAPKKMGFMQTFTKLKPKTDTTTTVPTIDAQNVPVDTSSSGPYLPKGGAKPRATEQPPPTPFKLRSGNVTPFKLMGSSPAKIFGGVFGGGGGGGGGFMGGIKNVMEQMQARKAAKQARRAGGGRAGGAGGFLGGVFGGRRRGGGAVPPHGDEAHTGGGGAIGGNVPMDAGAVAEALPPEMQEESVNIDQPLGNMASDIRLKENISKTGVSPSGIPIYEFNYIGGSNRYSGAMAQDLLETNPEAVSMDMSGHYMVNYNNIDVDMHLIN